MVDEAEDRYPFHIYPVTEEEPEPEPAPRKPEPEKVTALVESHSVRNFVRKFYYRFIQKPFQEIKERWLAYFAEFASSDDSPRESEHSQQSSVHVLMTPESGASAPARTADASPPRPESGRRPLSPPPANSKSAKQCQAHTVSRFRFMTSALGATVGLGQLWRFPYMAHKSGGAGFVIVYAAFTLLFGYPLFFMELAHGQYSSQNTLRGYNMVPVLRGVGFSMVAYSYVTIIYHIQMVGYGIHYLGASFNYTLPWSRCPNPPSEYNNFVCYSSSGNSTTYEKPFMCAGKLGTMIDVFRLCTDYSFRTKTLARCCDKPDSCDFDMDRDCRITRELPSQHFWRRELAIPLNATEPDEDRVHGYLGPANLKLLLCLFTTWSLVYLINSMSMKCSGIFVLIIVHGLLTAFIIMIGITAESDGFVDGVTHFFVPHKHSFNSKQLWIDALQQCLYSLGIGMGAVTSLGSISRFRSPCHIDALVITILVLIAGLLSGVTTFIGLGDMSREVKVNLFDMKFGPELALIAYSHITAKFPVAWLSSATFFLLYFLVGVLAMSGLLTGIALPIADLAKISFNNMYLLKFFIVLSCFSLGIPFIMRGGADYFQALDHFPSGIGLVVIVVFQVITVFVYGLGRFCEDIAFMTGVYPSRLFRYMLMLLPAVSVPAAFFYDFTMPESTWFLQLAAYGTLGFVLSPIALFMLCQLLRRPQESGWGYTVDAAEKYGPKAEELKCERRRFSTKRQIF